MFPSLVLHLELLVTLVLGSTSKLSICRVLLVRRRSDFFSRPGMKEAKFLHTSRVGLVRLDLMISGSRNPLTTWLSSVAGEAGKCRIRQRFYIFMQK